jgi:hypothetical protein
MGYRWKWDLPPWIKRTSKLRIKSTTKIANNIQAIVAENPAIPVNPKNAAAMASRKRERLVLTSQPP